MNAMLLSLDGSAKMLNRDDMSWFYNEFSDVVLTRTSIRRSLNLRRVLAHLLKNGMSLGCESPGLRRKRGVVPLPTKTARQPYRALLPSEWVENA